MVIGHVGIYRLLVYAQWGVEFLIFIFIFFCSSNISYGRAIFENNCNLVINQAFLIFDIRKVL